MFLLRMLLCSLGQKECINFGSQPKFLVRSHNNPPKSFGKKFVNRCEFLQRRVSLPPCWGRTHNATGRTRNATGHLCYLGTVPLLSTSLRIPLIPGEFDYRKPVGRDERMRGGEKRSLPAKRMLQTLLSFEKKNNLFYRPCQIHWSTSQHLRGVWGAGELIFPPLYLVGRMRMNNNERMEGRNAEVELNNLVLKNIKNNSEDVIKRC